jgi:1,4-alpha-glucan branching enzyme
MGFEWMDCSRPETSTVAFVRRGRTSKNQLMFVLNFTPVAHEVYKVKAPCKGKFTEILNSDDEKFGGEGRLNKKPVIAKEVEIEDEKGEKKKRYEIEIYLPPLSVVVLKYDYRG